MTSQINASLALMAADALARSVAGPSTAQRRFPLCKRMRPRRLRDDGVPHAVVNGRHRPAVQEPPR